MPVSSSRLRMTLAIIALIVALPFVLMAFFIDDWSRDLTTNTAATSADHPDARLRPVTVGSNAAGIRTALAALTADNASWSVVEEKPLPADSPLRDQIDGEPKAVHLVRTTSLMGYKDDVWLVIEDIGDGKVRLHGDSRSRIGKGDLGQNPRNLDELLSALSDTS